MNDYDILRYYEPVTYLKFFKMMTKMWLVHIFFPDLETSKKLKKLKSHPPSSVHEEKIF